MAMKSYFMEELITDATCDDLFDHIDDLLEFPNDDFMVEQGGMMETPYNPGGGFILPTAPVSPAVAPLIQSPPQKHDDNCEGLLEGGDMLRNHITINHAADTAEFECGGNKTCFKELDIADLEWVSNFMDDSANSSSIDYLPNSINKPKIQTESMFRTPSPVSVLHPNSRSISGSGGSASSSSSSSNSGSIGGTNSGKELVSFTSPNPVSVIPARARSKRPRPRPTAFSPRPQMITIHPFLDDECYGEYAMKKAAKEEPITPLAAEETSQVAVRKCTHCEIQKTPQWRAGPMGPKTLCNACGVRYKSGRLFPEYRPAASPTFVASLHSNSHKRVVEMRINGGPGAATSSCDLLEYIRRKE